jgi:uncharacterized protein YtpQ (UPF0354 family)
MPGTAASLFEQELTRRGVTFSFDRETGRYKVQHEGLELFVSLDNLARNYERDRDSAHITGFVDAVLASPADRPSWEEARPSILFCLEPSDYQQPPEIRSAISGRVDRVPVYYDEQEGTISWIAPAQIADWGVTPEEVEAAALGNLAAVLKDATIEHSDIDGVALGFIRTTLPFKSALILAPNLKEIVAPVLGWPLLAVIPDRDFLFLWAAKHDGFANRVGGTVVKEFSAAPYPLTTEVFEIGDEGIAAIGAFPVEKG